MAKQNKWLCDTCGQIIENVKDGWVEWITYYDEQRNHKGRDFRLVHHLPTSPLKGKTKNGCQFNGRFEYKKDKGMVSDLPLSSFLGSDGLMYLLSKIAEGDIPLEQLLEMIKRLHIPGYEYARNHLDRAMQKGIIEPNMYPGFYCQHDIRKVIAQGWPHDISKLKTKKPNLNLKSGFTEADLKNLLTSCDDMEGHHIIWVDNEGNVDITLLPEDRSPAGWEKSMGNKMKFRYETFQQGNEYVGFEGARDDEWVKELYQSLKRDWDLDRRGYIDDRA
jgi:hypothetical protein